MSLVPMPYPPPPSPHIVLQAISDFNSAALLQTLQAHNCYESGPEELHRQMVLSKLDNLAKTWIRHVSESKGLSMSSRRSWNPGGMVLPFGSCLLGVQGQGSDMDVICLAPRHVSRKAFFDSFTKVLESQKEVSNLKAVSAAYVPILVMDFDGIRVDMSFARFALRELHSGLNLGDTRLLADMSLTCIRSLSGFRSDMELTRMVPNKEAFQVTLRAIKLWTKQRGIYGQCLGYLGGVNCSILVARLCQFCPYAAPSTLVASFFQVYTTWPWPLPVTLKPPEVNNLGLRQWNPYGFEADAKAVMPIIKPAYPQDNCGYRITKSGFLIIMEEMREALVTCQQVTMGNAVWDKLFARPSFYLKYQHFLVLTVQSSDKVHQEVWLNFVKSKIRHFIDDLDKESSFDLAHIWPEVAVLSDKCANWSIGLKFSHSVCPEPEVTMDKHWVVNRLISKLCDNVNTNAKNLGIWKEGMSLSVKYCRQPDLAKHLSLPDGQVDKSPVSGSNNNKEDIIPQTASAKANDHVQESSGNLPDLLDNLNDELKDLSLTT